MIKGNERPPSGVWSVRAAKPLALNLEGFSKGLALRTWHPQRIALQLLGGYSSSSIPVALAVWGQFFQGPSFWFWKWKEIIEKDNQRTKQWKELDKALKTKTREARLREFNKAKNMKGY